MNILNNNYVYKIAILGAGSCGILSTCHFLSFTKSAEITLIHDPNIDTLGIGESTNPSFLYALELGTDFKIIKDLEKLDGTYKFGTYYKKWRDNEFLNPLIGGQIAIHFNTNKLKEYAIPRLKEKWKEKFKVLEGKILNVIDSDVAATIVLENSEESYDFVIDCRGFPDDYTDYKHPPGPTVNSCIVYDKPVYYDNIKYTEHTATDNGWMFTVPLSNRTSYGYLYNNNLTTINDAYDDFSKVTGELIQKENTRKYHFRSYYARKLIGKRVAKNGNRASFFEPMFANSLWIYDLNNKMIYDYMFKRASRELVNAQFEQNCIDVMGMIHYHYHGGSTITSKFWNYVSEISKERVSINETFNYIKPKLQECSQHRYYEDSLKPSWIYSAKNLYLLDNNFQYNYFDKDNFTLN